MKPIRVRARRATPEVMAELESRGMLRRVQAPEHARRVGQEDQVVERIEAAAIQRCAARADIPRRHDHGGDHGHRGPGERD